MGGKGHQTEQNTRTLVLKAVLSTPAPALPLIQTKNILGFPFNMHWLNELSFPKSTIVES